MTSKSDLTDDDFDSYFIDCEGVEDIREAQNLPVIVSESPDQDAEDELSPRASQHGDGETILNVCIGCITSIHHLVTSM